MSVQFPDALIRLCCLSQEQSKYCNDFIFENITGLSLILCFQWSTSMGQSWEFHFTSKEILELPNGTSPTRSFLVQKQARDMEITKWRSARRFQTIITSYRSVHFLYCFETRLQFFINLRVHAFTKLIETLAVTGSTDRYHV
jgi:hypothetical protein